MPPIRLCTCAVEDAASFYTSTDFKKIGMRWKGNFFGDTSFVNKWLVLRTYSSCSVQFEVYATRKIAHALFRLTPLALKMLRVAQREAIFCCYGNAASPWTSMAKRYEGRSEAPRL